MRTRKATAPERFAELEKLGMTTLTSPLIQEVLGISKQEALAVIVYGTSVDKIRLSKRVNSHEAAFTEYELSSWRQKWITEPWGVANVSRDCDQMAPD
jgi:hypothetical protein